MNPKVGATHPELAAMVARYIRYENYMQLCLTHVLSLLHHLYYRSFEASVVSEAEVISRFTNPHMHEGRLKRPRYSRDHLDAEPAKIGEQVTIAFPPCAKSFETSFSLSRTPFLTHVRCH